MRIVKCPKCGRHIHIADQCYHCGNTAGFVEAARLQLHENALLPYSRVEYMIECKKYDEAFAVSHEVIEWMPNLALVFWMRLLAKNKCANAEELIRKGFNCEEDADFCNALEFSSGAERETYQDIRTTVLDARKVLRAKILEHERSSKMATDIMKLHKSMRDELLQRKKKLFSLWSELEKTEQAMYTLEKDCLLLSSEHSSCLKESTAAAAALKNEIYKREECSAELLHGYHIRIGSILQQSEQAKDALNGMRWNHPWVKSFKELVRKRDEQIRDIGQELSSLKAYEAAVQKTLDDVDRIERRHRAAVIAVDAFDFRDASSLLGAAVSGEIFRSVGLGTATAASRQSDANH